VKLNRGIVLCGRDGWPRATVLGGVYEVGGARMNEESPVEDEEHERYTARPGGAPAVLGVRAWAAEGSGRSAGQRKV
jgi:hypothetical protein